MNEDIMLPELSAVSIHPWDKLKDDLFGKDYKSPIFDNVELSETFNISDNISSIEKIKKDHYDTILNSLTSSNINLSEIYQKPFYDSTNTYNSDIHKKYVDLVEMINNITLENLQDPKSVEELNKKIVFKYLDTFKK